MHTATLNRFGLSLARTARLVLFTLASRPRHAYSPLFAAKPVLVSNLVSTSVSTNRSRGTDGNS
ncbi:MAG: hypothetical protein JWR65_1024 [Massilia sp.]|nr:hypothetical protein [Massilia sp.]